MNKTAPFVSPRGAHAIRFKRLSPDRQRSVKKMVAHFLSEGCSSTEA